MNSDSTVSADKLAADAGDVAELPDADSNGTVTPGGPVPQKSGSDSGDQQAAPATAAAPDAEAPRVPDSEPVRPEHHTGDGVASGPAVDAVAATTPADPESPTVAATDPDATASSAADAGIPETPASDVSAQTETVPAKDQVASPDTTAPEKRRVRLNPTLDRGAARPVPSLKTTETPPPAAATPVRGEDPPAAEAAAAVPAAPPPPPPAAPVEIPGDDDLDAGMEAEIAAALETGEIGSGDASEAPSAEVQQAAEEAGEQPAPPGEEDLVEGAKLSGVIQSIHEDNVFLDFGLRQSGVVSKRQFGARKEPTVGDNVDIVVSRIDDDEGLILCSLPRGAARISGDWNAIAVGQTVDCMVNKTNKGGLEVSVSNLRGFMPASQVDLAYVSDLEAFVGQKLAARVTEVNPGRRRLVVSRRALLAEERAEAEAQIMGELEVGQVRNGQVKTIKDYGAFVDLGGVDGFLHIGQMSWQRIEHPSELLTEGQEVEVKVLAIEPDKKHPDRKRIGLGMRQLAANPWANVEGRFPKGSTQNGKVTRTETYGAFIELEPGVEGLVHISELDHKRVKRVTEVLNVGQQTEVQILEVDPRRKRISLSVKALTAPPEDAAGSAADEDLAPGQGQPYERKRKDDLKGGIGGTAPGGLFGNPSDFS